MSAVPIEERRDHGTPCKEIRRYLRAHAALAVALPEPDETFALGDLESEIGKPAVYKLHAAGALQKVEFVGRDPDTDNYGHTWRVTRTVTDWVDEMIGEVSLTPCGCSTGVHNIPGGTGDGAFTCKNDACDETFSEAVAREVVSG